MPLVSCLIGEECCQDVCKVRPREKGHGWGARSLGPLDSSSPRVARAVDSFTAEAPGERTFLSPLIVVDAWAISSMSDI